MAGSIGAGRVARLSRTTPIARGILRTHLSHVLDSAPRIRPRDHPKKSQARKNMIQIIRQPGGAWENIGGRKGRQLWKNQNGRRTLTQYGRQTLANFQDLTIHIPAIERGFPTADHPAPRDREVWYPISENSLPGMIEKLQDEVPT